MSMISSDSLLLPGVWQNGQRPVLSNVASTHVTQPAWEQQAVVAEHKTRSKQMAHSIAPRLAPQSCAKLSTLGKIRRTTMGQRLASGCKAGPRAYDDVGAAAEFGERVQCWGVSYHTAHCCTDSGLQLFRKACGHCAGEQRVMALPPHPNVTRVYAVVGQFAYLEQLDSTTVWSNQRRKRDALAGLRHLHTNGLCHGDVHSGNLVWRSDAKEFALTDFETVRPSNSSCNSSDVRRVKDSVCC